MLTIELQPRIPSHGFLLVLVADRLDATEAPPSRSALDLRAVSPHSPLP